MAATVHLPGEAPVTTCKAVPRRYEETKPVIIQNDAHGKILGIGHDLHLRSVDQFEIEKRHAIDQAEAAVWAQAKLVKHEAVEKAKQECLLEQQKAVKKIQKTHEKALKEESLRVEMTMQKLALQQVSQERTEGDERRRIALKDCEERWQQKLLQAVEGARADEKWVAAEHITILNRAHQLDMDEQIKKEHKERTELLRNLNETKEQEKISAVERAKLLEQKIVTEQLEIVKQAYELELSRMKTEWMAHQNEVVERDAAIRDLVISKRAVIDRLVDMKAGFQKYVILMSQFVDGQGDFMIPDVNVDEL